MKPVTVTRNFVKYLAAAFLAVGCTHEEAVYQPQAPKESEPEASSPFLPGSAIVELDDNLNSLVEENLAMGMDLTKALTKAPGLQGIMDEIGAESMERVFPDAGEYEARTRKMGLHRFYKVKFSKEASVTKAIADFKSLPGIVSVSPSHEISRRSFNDPKLSKQWHFINNYYAGCDINVKDVWEKYSVGSESVIVCVVDEPVDATHPDLKANIWKDDAGHTGYNYARNSYDLTVRPGSGWWSIGDVGHGTHVGGTIAAVNNNGVGLCGIAGGDAANGKSGVKLMSHAIFSGDSNASDDATYRAIKEGADKGAVISQNSWGYSCDSNYDGYVSSSELNYWKSLEPDAAMIAAVKYFMTYAGCDANGNQRDDSPMKGGLVFFAAGNDNASFDYVSANDENVIAVGSWGYDGSKADYSQWGDWVDIAAPGGGATNSTDMVWSTLPTKIESSGYGGEGWVGTSMACPHASGVAALIVSYFGGPGFTNEKAKDILFSGLGETIGGNRPIGKKLDALASFEYGIKTYGPGTGPGGGGGGGGGEQNHAPTITLGTYSMSLTYDEKKTVEVTTSDSDGDDVTVTVSTSATAAVSYNAATGICTINSSKVAPGEYKVTFIAKDTKNASTTATLTFTVADNQAPMLYAAQNIYTLKAHETQMIVISASDPDGDDVVITCPTPGSDAVSYASGFLQIDARKAPAGTYKAIVRATDVPTSSNVESKYAEMSITYTILPNHAPVVQKNLEDKLQYGLGAITYSLDNLFSDEDGETLAYSAETDNGKVASVKVEGNQLKLTPMSYGHAKITIIAKDNLGASASMSYQIAFADKDNPVAATSTTVTNSLELSIDTETPTNVTVTIYSSTGAVVLEYYATASAFYSMTIDTTSLAPGRYTAVVKYNGQSKTLKFVKF